jgi:hypothetical protein
VPTIKTLLLWVNAVLSICNQKGNIGVPELSVKDQIKKVVELQKIDGEIYNLKVKLKEKPAVLEHLKEEFELHKGALAALEQKFKAAQLDRKAKELELKAQEEEVAKANTQLSQIKTNKEYTAKISEIEHIKADQSIVEEKILLSFEECDSINVEIEKEKLKVAEEEKNYLAKKKEAEDDIKVIEDRIKVLGSQRQQSIPGINGEYLSRYERILEHKGGLAIVPIEGGSCGGCFMNVTPQKINSIKMNDQLVFCEMCARILYLEDDC